MSWLSALFYFVSCLDTPTSIHYLQYLRECGKYDIYPLVTSKPILSTDSGQITD